MCQDRPHRLKTIKDQGTWQFFSTTVTYRLLFLLFKMFFLQRTLQARKTRLPYCGRLATQIEPQCSRRSETVCSTFPRNINSGTKDLKNYRSPKFLSGFKDNSTLPTNSKGKSFFLNSDTSHNTNINADRSLYFKCVCSRLLLQHHSVKCGIK